MPFFKSMGQLPRRQFSQFRQPDGAMYFEELTGHVGFFGDGTTMYHRNSPCAIKGAEEVKLAEPKMVSNQPLLPHHIRPKALSFVGDCVTGRIVLMGNDDLTMSYSISTNPSPLYRNMVGDELVFVDSGSARVESPFGVLLVRRGDYVVLPSGCTHRWVPQGDGPLSLLIVETTGHITFPEHYQTARGQFLSTAPFNELHLRGPEELLNFDERDVDILYKSRGGFTKYTMDTHPFDVVGWYGCMYPYALNIWDFSPVTGSFHRTPPIHQTFIGPKFIVMSFVPRKFEFDKEAMRTPPHHSNPDCDETLYYMSGNFRSRDGAGFDEGSMSLHPGGFTHGPQPENLERALSIDATQETAVMIDTFSPLKLSTEALKVQDPSYLKVWQRS
jgi:homogentisate 1,2-dioxygenase